MEEVFPLRIYRVDCLEAQNSQFSMFNDKNKNKNLKDLNIIIRSWQS